MLSGGKTQADEGPFLKEERWVLDAISERLGSVIERKQAEETLRESEAKYRFLSEKMTDLVWTMDMNLHTTYVSPSIEKMLGFTPEERMTQNLADQITPASLAQVQSQLLEELEHERKGDADLNRSIKIDVEYYRKDGSTVWTENIVNGIRDESGNLIGLHGLSRDITEHRKAHEALQTSEKSFRDLANNIPGMVYRVFLMEENKMEFFNPMLKQMLGFTVEDLKKGEVCSIEPLIVDEDRPAVVSSVKKGHKRKQTILY